MQEEHSEEDYEDCKSEQHADDDRSNDSSSESESDDERDDRELMQALKHMIRLGVEERALELLEGEPELKHISEQVKIESAKREIEIEEEEE